VCRRFPLSLVGCVRNRPFEHPDQCERRSSEERTTERDRAVAGVAAALLQPAPQTGAEEEKQERD
jgi:hypothetical protein